MTKISATIVADSLAPTKDRLTTMSITFPRFILAEAKTHRILSQDGSIIQLQDISLNNTSELSKNSASSRAIPFNKMVKSVQENPFIPVAWQKDHSGMQGVEYFDKETFQPQGYSNHILVTEGLKMSWLAGRDSAIASSTHKNQLGLTKQLCNRELEPYTWHTVLISGTEWENFFSLRCPQYQLPNEKDDKIFKSWKDLTNYYEELHHDFWTGLHLEEYTELERLKCNKGQAEIHMMALAETMWDAMNESIPKELKEGEWHIPYEDKIDFSNNSFIANYSKNLGRDSSDLSVEELDKLVINISTAMCARASYTVVGDEKEVSYETLLRIHDRMANQVPFHASPFEHCGQVMTNEEHSLWTRGKLVQIEGLNKQNETVNNGQTEGWCRNYRGFIQYRELLENK